MVDLITEHIATWTAAQIPKTNGGRGRGRGSNGQSSHGIKKLQELILELAVRGKLVPQDPSDEPASILLKKIAAEKKRLTKEGLIRKQKSLAKIGTDEKPFELPEGWEWARLGETGLGNTGKTPPTGNPKYYDGDIPFLGPGQITPEGNITDSGKSLTEEGCGYSAITEPGDILMVCIGGSIGKSAIAQSKAAFNQQINCIHPLFVDSTYLNYAMNTPHFQGSILDAASGSATPIINRSKWEELIIGIPPLVEQYRIVAKVDELMALCDKLGQQQTDSSDTHQTLVETLLATLTTIADPAEFAQGWHRIASHFDTLFTTEESIDQLKETILQLAIMGKLVPQDPNDEPASVLLEEIAKEKNRLIKESNIKKQASLPKISEAEKPFNLPDGWSFVRLGDLSKLITKGSSPKWQGVAYTEHPEDVLFITSENVGSYVLKLDSRKYVERKFNEVEPRSILEKGDFLMNIVGASIGRTAIYCIDDLANINQAVCLIRLLAQYMDSQYLLHFFNSEVCISYMFDKQVDNARANLSMGNIAKFVIPFPPLPEQHRIVAKVDELMALCDTLRKCLHDSQTTQVQLADVIVEQAVA